VEEAYISVMLLPTLHEEPALWLWEYFYFFTNLRGNRTNLFLPCLRLFVTRHRKLLHSCCHQL